MYSQLFIVLGVDRARLSLRDRMFGQPFIVLGVDRARLQQGGSYAVRRAFVFVWKGESSIFRLCSIEWWVLTSLYQVIP